MSRVCSIILYTLVSMAFGSDSEQPGPIEKTQGCSSGVCPKKGEVLLQKKKSQPNQDRITTVVEDSAKSETDHRIKQPFTYSSLGTNIRCKSKYRNGDWGDLGQDLTEQECLDACTASEECKWVGIDSNGKCTSFYSCDDTQDKDGSSLWRRFNWAAATRKRGLGMRPGEVKEGSGDVQCTDATSLGLDDSWYYTWGATDSVNDNEVDGKDLSKCEKEGTHIAQEFVPMILRCDSVDDIWENIDWYKTKWEALNAKFLLGYNEPDGAHACSPKEGAEKWVTVQKIANSFDPPLRLASPSPCSGSGTSCPGGGIAFGSSPWLNQFFGNCSEIPECEPDMVEFIGFHDYEGDFDTRDDNLQVRLANVPTNYPFSNGNKRQIWVTEMNVACGQTSLCRDKNYKKSKIYRNGNVKWPSSIEDSISPEEQLWFMKQAVPYLESNEDVFRYTWFGIRTSNQLSGQPNLLSATDGSDNTPTTLGEYYMTAEEA